MIRSHGKTADTLLVIFLAVLSVLFFLPLFIVLMNSFKGQFYITDAPFALPNAETFAGLSNYVGGIAKTDFFRALGYSLIITVGSVGLILLCTSMAAWFLVRVRNKWTSALYYVFVFSYEFLKLFIFLF